MEIRKRFDVAIVGSPLQALSAIEAAHYYKLDPAWLFVRYVSAERRHRNNKHMDMVLENHNFKKIIKLGTHQYATLNHLQILALYLFLLLCRSRIRNLVIGEWRSDWMQRCIDISRKNEVILCDDGIIMVDILRNKLEKDVRWKASEGSTRLKSIVKKTITRMLGSRGVHDAKFRLFTAFFDKADSNKVTIDHNSYDYIKSKLNAKSPSGVYYFGTKYSEAGYFSLGVELRFLNGVFRFLREREKSEPIFYVPHRDDSVEKIKAVEKIGFKVLYLESPAELYFLSAETFPKSISGAFTTAVANLSSIYKPQNVTLFRLPIEEIVSEKREHVETIYDFYEKRGFSVIDLIT
jgi:hypothetical protein